MGGALAAVLVGPWTAVLCLSVVLVVQALLMADGGITALGTNITLIGIVTVVVGYGVFVVLRRVLPKRLGMVAPAAAVGALVSVPVAALVFTLLFAVGGNVPGRPGRRHDRDARLAHRDRRRRGGRDRPGRRERRGRAPRPRPRRPSAPGRARARAPHGGHADEHPPLLRGRPGRAACSSPASRATTPARTPTAWSTSPSRPASSTPPRTRRPPTARWPTTRRPASTTPASAAASPA